MCVNNKLNAVLLIIVFSLVFALPFLTVLQSDFHTDSDLSGPSSRHFGISLFSSDLNFPHQQVHHEQEIPRIYAATRICLARLRILYSRSGNALLVWNQVRAERRSYSA